MSIYPIHYTLFDYGDGVLIELHEYSNKVYSLTCLDHGNKDVQQNKTFKTEVIYSSSGTSPYYYDQIINAINAYKKWKL